MKKIGIEKRRILSFILILNFFFTTYYLSMNRTKGISNQFFNTKKLQLRSCLQIKTSTQSYAEHDPITITSDFQLSNSGFLGNGTIDDPVRIEGYNITASNGPLISISNTTHYFNIRNNLLNGSNAATEGIYFSNVKHGTIENNIICNNKAVDGGVVLEFSSSSHNLIINNSIFDNSLGLNVGGNNNTIVNNTIYRNAMQAIWLNIGTYNNTIVDNTIYGNSWSGIELEQSSYNFISCNTVYSNLHGIFIGGVYNNILENSVYDSGETECYGIGLENCKNNTISRNTVHISLGGKIFYEAINNTITHNGLSASSSDINLILNNTINENRGFGVVSDTNSRKNIVALNSFNNNNPEGWRQALDDGLNNSFFQNYWSDWTNPDDDSNGIVDSIYALEGSAENSDSFPLVTLEYEYIDIRELLNIRILYPTENDTLNGTVNVQWDVSVGSYYLEAQYLNLIFNIQYTIQISSDGGENWIRIADTLTTHQYMWNTTLVTDGTTYLIKVITSTTNGHAIETISRVFSVCNNKEFEAFPIQLITQITSIFLVLCCTTAVGYYVVNKKFRTPSFTEYFQIDQIEFLKPIYHKVIVGLENIKTAIISETMVTPLLEEPTTPTSLAKWFPTDYRSELKSELKGRTVLTLIEIAFLYAEDANLTILAQNLDVPPTTLSDELKKLVKLDYLDFHVSPQVLHDGRSRHYIITPKGISFLKILKSALELSIRRIKEKERSMAI